MNALDPRTPPRSALVVDDDDFVRGAIAQILKRLGVAEVRTADNGLQARDSLENEGPTELIVCDLMMPDSDGIELMGQVQRLCPQGRVVLVSSSGPKLLRSARELAEHQGIEVLGVLGKPVRQAELAALLGQAPAARSVPAPSAAPAPRPPPPWDESQLSAALQAGEFLIDVQPQLCLHTRRVVGVEALVRWHSPLFGQLPPDRFLPELERAGLMEQLTDLVLRQAIDCCAAWLRQGLDLRVAVNISPGCLGDRRLPSRIHDLADAAGIDVSRVVVEVTENGLLQESSTPLEVLTRLRLHGMEVSMDDYGTGYSSLERLQRIAFSELKIDRRFVSAAVADAEARGIVESSLSLAQRLGLHTVAEGVETSGDIALMAELGCDSVQGYCVSRPMAPALLPAWMAAQGLPSCLLREPPCPVAHQCVLARGLGPEF